VPGGRRDSVGPDGKADEGPVLRVMTLFNDYRSRCDGEGRSIALTTAALESHGVEVIPVRRSSKEIRWTLAARVRGGLGGAFNLASYRRVLAAVRRERPDVVHAHNLYPLLSPSALLACRRAGVPTVLSIHNYSFSCPAWFHFSHGEVCERCMGGREYWCAWRNCRANRAESVAYALRSFLVRRAGLLRRNATIVVALTEFARQRLIAAGFAPARISVVPNMVDVPPGPTDAVRGSYVAFAGRLSAEKGVRVLLEAARRVPAIPVRLAGEGPTAGAIASGAASNVAIVGFLAGSELVDFYRRARAVVVPSLWFEMSPYTILEAMSHGVPVITSDIGGLREIVTDGEDGLLVPPGDAGALAAAIERLWTDDGLCRSLAAGARRRAETRYGAEAHVASILAVYRRALSVSPRWPA
jgi:glycosyltransferase involved in cell wall biosynthesis